MLFLLFRITGVYVFVIGFFATLYKFFDYNVLNYVESINEACSDYWWKNVLYINNFYAEDELPVSYQYSISHKLRSLA